MNYVVGREGWLAAPVGSRMTTGDAARLHHWEAVNAPLMPIEREIAAAWAQARDDLGVQVTLLGSIPEPDGGTQPYCVRVAGFECQPKEDLR